LPIAHTQPPDSRQRGPMQIKCRVSALPRSKSKSNYNFLSFSRDYLCRLKTNLSTKQTSERPPQLGDGIPPKTSVVSLMEYKHFHLHAFEREPGKWRASVRRTDGKPVKVIGQKKLEKSVTRFDATTAVAAICMAMATIDAGTFLRDRMATEKFWRLRRQSSGALATGNRIYPALRRTSQDHPGPPGSGRKSSRRSRLPE